MEAKDCCYLGLIVLTGTVLYCRGLQAGAARARMIYGKLFDYSHLLTKLPPPQDSQPSPAWNQAAWRCRKSHLVKTTIQGIFGIN